MRISVLTIGAIASIIAINSVFADTTITTKDYVDTNFQTKIPAGSFGENNSVVTYGANAGDTQERLILHPTTTINDDSLGNFLLNGKLFDDHVIIRLFKQQLGATDEQYDDALLPAKYINRGLGAKQYKITPGTTGSVVTYNGTDTNRNGGALFSERAIYDGSTTYDSTTDANKLITAGAVDNKQNKMTCTRWLDTPENPDHTDENCLLWSIAN